MATTVTLSGSGEVGDIATWSVTEEATPVSIANSAGSVGTCSITAAIRDGSIFAGNNAIALTHPVLGTWTGRVLAPTLAGPSVTLACAGSPEFLNARKSAPAQVNVGSIAKFFGSSGSGNGQFEGPYGIAVAPNGNIVVCDRNNDRVQVFNSSGVFQFAFGTSGTGNGQFDRPAAVTVLSNNNIVVADTSNSRVQIFNSAGVYQSQFGSFGTGDSDFTFPTGIGRDGSNNIFVSDGGSSLANYIKKFNSSGTFQSKFGGYGDGDGKFLSAAGLFYDLTNNKIYVADAGTSRVQVFNSSGVLQLTLNTNLSSQYGPNLPTTGPFGVVANSSYVYVAETSGDSVKKFTVAGEFVGSLGSFGSNSTELNNPRGVALTGAGSLIASDSGNDRVVTVTFPSEHRVALSDVFRAYVELCDPGLANHAFSYDCSTDPLVIYGAWTEKNVWVMLKQLAAATYREVYYKNGTVHVEDIGVRILPISNRTVARITPSNQGSSRYIRIVNQNVIAGDGLLMYDAGDEQALYSIDTGQVREITVTLASSPVVVNNPFPVASDTPGPGQYRVRDNAGEVVSANDWNASGASVQVSISGQQLSIIITGPTAAMGNHTGPYTFATELDGVTIPAFSVTGSGVAASPEVMQIGTGADRDKITIDYVQEIDSPFITDAEVGYDAGIWAAVESLGTAEISFAIAPIAGWEFGDYPGSMFTLYDCRWRVTRAVIGNAAVQITAAWHTTVGDFDSAWAGKTVGDFDTFWSGYETGDLQLRPLRTA